MITDKIFNYCKKSSITRLFWLVAIFLGLIYAWSARHYMNPDGLSYLDMSDAYLHRNWSMLINASRSPFYPFLLGLALHLFKHSSYWEFTIVHLVNFMLYLFALGSFQFFLRELLHHHRYRTAQVSKDGYMILPEWVLMALGYILFIWSSLYMITIELVAPEMCVSALVYLISGILLRIRRRAAWFDFVLLGLILGLGYLTKAVMFLLAFVFLGVALFLVGNLKKAIPRALTGLMLFILITSPFLTTYYKTKGNLPFSDIGKISSLSPSVVYWQGETPGNGAPRHPARKLYDTPAVYEFANPVEGTYPLWYDPCYWIEGYIYRFDLKVRVNALITNIKEILRLFFKVPSILLINLVFIFYFMNRRRRLFIRGVLEHWELLVPAISALVIFSLVHLEPRYIAPFVVLLWMGILSCVRLPDLPELRNALMFLIRAAIIIIMIFISVLSIPEAYSVVYSLTKGEDKVINTHWQVADALRRLGIKKQDRVALLGDGYDAYWARLASVKIIAEIPSNNVNNFWAADTSVKAKVIEILEQTGVRVVVAKDVPQNYSSSAGWQKIDNTDYYVFILK